MFRACLRSVLVLALVVASTVLGASSLRVARADSPSGYPFPTNQYITYDDSGKQSDVINAIFYSRKGTGLAALLHDWLLAGTGWGDDHVVSGQHFPGAGGPHQDFTITSDTSVFTVGTEQKRNHVRFWSKVYNDWEVVYAAASIEYLCNKVPQYIYHCLPPDSFRAGRDGGDYCWTGDSAELFRSGCYHVEGLTALVKRALAAQHVPYSISQLTDLETSTYKKSESEVKTKGCVVPCIESWDVKADGIIDVFHIELQSTPTVTLCRDTNYSGGCADFSGNVPYVGNFWNDQASSVVLGPNVQKVALFVDANYGGDCLIITQNTPNLTKIPGHSPTGTWNDVISSLKVNGDCPRLPPNARDYHGVWVGDQYQGHPLTQITLRPYDVSDWISVYFRNDGPGTWDENTKLLAWQPGTSDPYAYVPADDFCHPYDQDWQRCSRPGIPAWIGNGRRIAPGGVGLFTFRIQAPFVDTTRTFRIYFRPAQLINGNYQWIDQTNGQPTYEYFDVTVLADRSSSGSGGGSGNKCHAIFDRALSETISADSAAQPASNTLVACYTPPGDNGGGGNGGGSNGGGGGGGCTSVLVPAARFATLPDDAAASPATNRYIC